MHTLLLALILVILVAEYGLNRWLSVLNVRNSRIPLPSELSGIYDPESYSRQQEYFRTNVKFGTLSATFNLLLIAGMYVAGGFGWLDTWLLPVTDNEILRSLLFFGVLFIVSDLLNLPFDYYDTFVIEAKFGFNKTTPGLFLLDKLKSTLLMIVLGGGLLALIIWIYLLTSTYFWLLAFGVLTFFGLVMSMFYNKFLDTIRIA